MQQPLKDTKNKQKRGGAIAGAGRKKRDAYSTIKITAPNTQLQAIEDASIKNRSAAYQAAMDFYLNYLHNSQTIIELNNQISISQNTANPRFSITIKPFKP